MSTNCNDEAIDADHLTKLTRFAVQEAAEAMFTIASDGRFLDVNEIACERLEYERHELLNMYVGDIDPLYPREQWPVLWERLRTLGKIILQGRHRTKSGREFEVEISASYFGFDGQEYCCSFARDTTLQRQSEQIATIQQKVLAEAATDSSNLSETLNLLCEMVEELIPESLASIMLLDLNDDCLRFEAGPKLSPVVRAAFEPLRIGECAGSCGSAAYSKQPVIVEDTRHSKYWKSFQHIVEQFNLLACWSYPIFDEHEQVLGTFAISHQQIRRPKGFHLQILETSSHLASLAIRRQRFEEELRLAHDELAHVSRWNMMGEMASSLAHELNQPLSAIVNYASALELQVKQSDHAKVFVEHSKRIKEQSLRAGNIVTSMRNMTKKCPTNRVVTSLEIAIRECLAMLEPQLRQNRIQFSLSVGEDVPPVAIDKVQIQQVLMNLVQNASEAMSTVDPKDRSILVQISSVDDEVRLSVEDSGPKIASEDLAAVFEPFQTTKPDGMGLGLSICRSIAKMHLGRLFAEPRVPTGAAFHLCLPFAPQHDCDYSHIQ